MFDAAKNLELKKKFDIVIMAAAIADYVPTIQSKKSK